MKLHANAALSLNGRRQLLPSAVVEREWTVTQAAEAAGVSVRCARKWVGRYRAEGEPGCWIVPRRRSRIAHRTGERAGRGDRGAADGCGSPARRSPSARTWRSRPSRGSSPGSGWASSDAWAWSRAVRYERERPGELIHIDVKKLGRIERGAGHRVTGRPPAASGQRAATPPASSPDRRLGVRAHRDR